ncbi:phage tail protein [Streptomyces sp. JNUCC 63]
MGVDAASAAPDPIPPEHTTLDADVAATDQKIADSGIDIPVTREIPDGPFAAARDARAGLGEVAQRTPQRIQAEQRQAIDSAQADMAQLQQQAVAALRGARSGTVTAVGGGQTAAVASEEHTREAVARRAQQIYDDAHKQVDGLLQPLSRTAVARWEAGLTRLSQEFHDSLDRVKRWIDDRHSGVGGAILAVGDYIGGLPDWVTDEYNRAERTFGDGVCELLTSISSDVNGVIAAAQAVIQHARTDIDTAFRAMEAEFPEWAAQERARFGGMLDGLTRRVTEARTSFVRDVSQRAVTAVNQVHAEAQALREEAGGLIGRVVAAIEEFIDDPVRAVINGLLRLVGIPPAAFWAVIAKIEQVISDIADDPENFVNNLVAGVKQGFEQFFDNFGSHVLHGFWDWLFSGLKTPVPMPRDLSARSLFGFALQLMGITWPRVREILVRHVGPTAVEVVEAAWQLVSVLVERGPEGLVELLKEQLTPENLIGMVLDAAVHYLIETLIQQVVVRVVGLLNPAGAIAQAIDLIYQVCAWIFRNAARIFRFVEAVVNGMADVVAGNIAGLATAVEKALASLIPPVIDFLAGLLHLGGLPGEVADVITRLQAVVYAAMDRVIGFLAARALALLKRLGIGGDKDGKHRGDDELGTTVRFTAAHESHRLYVQKEGNRAELMVASAPTTIPDLIAGWNGKLKEGQPADEQKRKEAVKLIGTLSGAAETANTEASRLVAQFDNAARDVTSDDKPPDDSALKASEQSIASTLHQLFTLFGEDSRAANLAAVRVGLPSQGLAHTETVLESWKQRYIEPPEAKPLEGRQGKVWDTASFQPDGLAPSEVLDSSANHAKLLGYFETGVAHQGADTEEFRAFALTNTSASHDVRAQFFRSLGSRVAAKLRDDGSARLTGTGDSDLRTKVRGIRFVPSASNYGSFKPWPTTPVSILVHSVIIPSGPLEAFRAFVRGDTVGGVSYEEFIAELWRDQKTRTWLADRLRGIQAGQHEWLPVSIGYEVLQHAVEAGREDLRKGLGWISLLESLRSPTNGVLWKIVRPPVIVPGEKAQEGPGIEPQGHVAALSRERYTLVQDGLTVGTGQFHDALRAFFRQNRSMDPAAWVDALLAHLPTIMWTGSNIPIPVELRNRPIGAFYAMPSGLYAADLTVAQVQAEVQERFEKQIKAAFLAAKAGIR